MDFTFIQAVWTIVVMVTFLGIVAWAWSGKRKADFDAAARLPFEEDDRPEPSPQASPQNSGVNHG